MYRNLYILLYAFSVLAAFPALAEERQFLFHSIDVDDGLSQNSVMDIIQDRTGFIWFGTKDGLDRYDGTDIIKFSPDNAIPGNESVTVLCEDGSGLIWVGTNAGLCVYDPEYERERRFLKKTSSGERISRTVNNIAVSQTGQIWIASSNQGFFCYDPVKDSLFCRTSDLSGSVSYAEARNICIDAKNRCYIDTGDGNVYLSDDGLLSVQPISESPVFRSTRINKLVILSYSRLFVCTVQGLFCINLSSGEMEEVDLGMDRFRHVHDIIIAGDGDIWVASDTGIVILDQNMKVKKFLLPEWGDANSPDDIATYSLCLDRDGGLWAGTYFGGAGYYPKDYLHIRRYYPKSYSEHFGQRVREIVPDADGTLWIGTEDRGLVHFYPEKGTYDPVRDPAISDNVHGLCLDGDWLWIGTYDREKGLVRYNVKTGEVIPYPDAGLEIFAIEKTRRGIILLGTISGLKYYDRSRDTFVRDSVITCFVNDIKEDSSGNLWVATNSEGLYMRDALSSEWSHFLYNESDTSSLAANNVLSIFEDSKSRIWLTTQGGGVCRYLPDRSEFRRYRCGKDIPCSTVYRIEEDSKGTYWMTTNNGLVKYDGLTGNYAVYTTADGLLSNQFNYSSSCVDTSGRMWLGCIKGLISFNPNDLIDVVPSWPVVFTGLSIYNSPVHIGEKGSPLSKSINVLDRLELSSSQSTFSIKVSSLNFRSKKPVRMYYRLEGYDSEWYPVMDNTISYTRLAPGSYTLSISESPSGEIVKELSVKVRPPFYRTGMAYVAYVLIVLSLLLYGYRRLLKKQKEEKARLEKERIREMYIEKFNFFTNIAHEIRTPLTLISGPLESLKKSMEGIDNAEVKEDLDLISNNTERLTVLINQLLDFRKAEQGSFRLDLSECDIPSIVRDIFEKFPPTARLRGIDMTLSLPEESFTAMVDKESIVKILSNMLSNALKYAKSYARLELQLDRDAGKYRIVLTNDGKVVPADMREKIFHPFVRYVEGSMVTGSGIGLTLARSLAELHRGSLYMDTDGSVNRFICELPLVDAEYNAAQPSRPSQDISAVNRKDVQYGQKQGKASILVVEDNVEMRAFLERQLSVESYSVTVATDGLDAEKKIEDVTSSFDLVISDIMMPEKDGYELCAWIKGNVQTSHIPVILLTAKTDVGSKIEGLDSGADAYIEKPFSLTYLISSVSSILENRERVRRHFLNSPLGGVSELARTSADKEFLTALDKFIAEHISDPDVSVNDMAGAVFMSPSNLFRKLKGIVDMAPVEYLQLQRLKYAAELLSERRYSVADVSAKAGFNSNTYFTLCFKKQFGVTPSAFMKKH